MQHSQLNICSRGFKWAEARQFLPIPLDTDTMWRVSLSWWWLLLPRPSELPVCNVRLCQNANHPAQKQTLKDLMWTCFSFEQLKCQTLFLWNALGGGKGFEIDVRIRSSWYFVGFPVPATRFRCIAMTHRKGVEPLLLMFCKLWHSAHFLLRFWQLLQIVGVCVCLK